MITVVIENMRTLTGRHEIPLRPLTIITGENSSGKSTFLAALSVVCDREGFPFQPAFNRPPYSLGNYDTIATYKGGRAGRAKTFSLGYQNAAAGPNDARSAIATFASEGGEATVRRFEAESQALRIEIEIVGSEAGQTRGSVRVTSGDQTYGHPISVQRGAERRPLNLLELVLSSRRVGAETDTLQLFRLLADFSFNIAPQRAISVAPIRSKPERTYSQLASTYEPAGDHIPFILERLTREGGREGKNVLASLRRFGAESGLFRDFDVKTLGKNAGDPFQLIVNVGGRSANLTDVGYGVSQALPVIVQTVLAAKGSLILLQQPEVHLHPKAQAALGSFFVDTVANQGKHLVIETHSDFIIDRVRNEVASGRLASEAVSILFFSRVESEALVSRIELDRQGNILGAPDNYRQFFLEEELKLLGVNAL